MFNGYSGIDGRGLNGFGGGSDAPALPDLLKALQAGYTFGVTDQTGGSAFRVESLESSLKVLTYSEEHIRLWRSLPKMQAYNTVEEFNLLTDYGDTANAFLPEGVLPESEDSVYSRKVALIKYMGTTRVVTHPMTLVRSAHGDVIAMENRNGILWLLRKIEQALFWGDNTLTYQYNSASGGNEGIEWSGLNSQIDQTSFYDAKGQPLTEGLLMDASEQLAENFAKVTHLFCPYKVATDFSKTYFSKERVIMPSPTGGLNAGTVIDKFNSQFGPVDICADIFLTKNRKADGPAPASARSANAPQTPASIATASPTGTDGSWKVLGAVAYEVTAVNRFGESAASAASSSVTVTSAVQHVPLTITNPNPISGLTPDYFNIYRQDGGTGNFWYIASVAIGNITSGGTTTYNDLGFYMTNTSTAFLMQLDPTVLAIKQLAPMMKMDLAILGPAIRWMILFYATLAVYAPKKILKIVNIGDLSN